MKTDPDALLSEISDAVATVKGAPAPPKLFRIHPLDVQMLLKRYPAPEDYSFASVIKKLIGVPVQEDCGVRRGHPEVDYE